MFESLYLGLGQQLSRQLFDETRQHLAKPRFRVSSLLAYSIAGLVHGVTLGFAALGVWLLMRYAFEPIPMIGGLLCLDLAWMLRPSLGKIARSGAAGREEFPTLYGIADRIAAALGTRPARQFIVDGSFNASFREVGLFRNRVITIGLPLFAIHTPEERIALVGHELAHGANGDLTRGIFIGGAVATLIEWYEHLKPGLIWDPSDKSLFAFLSVPARVALLALSSVPWLGAFLLVHLLFRDSQRAEYLADVLAARVSGTDAMIGSLHKLYLDATVDRTIQELALARVQVGLIEALRRHVAAVPPREIERLRRVGMLEGARLDVTHPPTAYRIEVIKADRTSTAQVRVSSEEAARMEDELRVLEATIQADLIDAYRDDLYSG